MATGNKQKITIQSPTNLTKDEIDHMVKEAAVYAEEDGKRREESTTRNKANIELDTAERTLRDLGEQIPVEQQRKLRDAIDRLRMSLQTYELQKISQDTKALQDQLFAVSTDAYYSLETGKVAGGKPGAGSVTVSSDEPSEEDLFGWFKK